MNDINKAPNDFFKNLENTKTIKYNSVIQIQIKSLSEKKFTQAMEFEISQLPDDSQWILNTQCIWVDMKLGFMTIISGKRQVYLMHLNFL